MNSPPWPYIDVAEKLTGDLFNPAMHLNEQ